MLLLIGIAGGAGAASVPVSVTVTVDGITPATVDLSLGKGSSSTLNPTLHLATSPPRADILFAVDTTGSMGAAIADARADAASIVSGIQASVPAARFAVASFKDYPIAPFGNSTDYPWRVDQDFTDNATPISCSATDSTVSPIDCALAGLSAGGGNDEPEAYNRAFFEAYSSDALTYRSDTPRFMVVLGDAYAHDVAQQTAFPLCPNTANTDPGRDGAVGGGDDLSTEPTLRALKEPQHEPLVRHVQPAPTARRHGGADERGLPGSARRVHGWQRSRPRRDRLAARPRSSR